MPRVMTSGKRHRTVLATPCTGAMLDSFDLRALAADLPVEAVTPLVCVEHDPEARHRSLVAERLRAEHGPPVTDLRPG